MFMEKPGFVSGNASVTYPLESLSIMAMGSITHKLPSLQYCDTAGLSDTYISLSNEGRIRLSIGPYLPVIKLPTPLSATSLMNEQNMIALFGLIGALLYFVVGRTIINILDEKRSELDGWRVVEGQWRFFKILFFPLIIVWEVVVMMSDYLTDAVIGFFDYRMIARKGRKSRD